MSDLSGPLERLRELRSAGASVADEPIGKELLRALGIDRPEGYVVAGPEAAVDAACSLGGPVAVKLVARDLPHKSDIGAVAGPLETPSAVRAAAERIARLGGDGLLVERWQAGGVACFAGLALGTEFGPVVSFGLGGIWVEILRDVAHRLAPIDEREAREMILSLRATPLLLGARGQRAVDLDALIASICRLSALAASRDAVELISEIDVNPLLALDDARSIALDVTVVLRPVAVSAASAPTVANVST